MKTGNLSLSDNEAIYDFDRFCGGVLHIKESKIRRTPHLYNDVSVVDFGDCFTCGDSIIHQIGQHYGHGIVRHGEIGQIIQLQNYADLMLVCNGTFVIEKDMISPFVGIDRKRP